MKIYPFYRAFAISTAVFIANSLLPADPLYTVTVLTDPSGASIYPTGLNDDEQVVGPASPGNSAPFQIFLYQRGNLIHVSPGPPFLPGTTGYYVYINNSGEITGSAGISGENIHAFSLNAGGVTTDLGTLGGGPLDVSMPSGINNPGQIVGTSTIGNTSTGCPPTCAQYEYPFVYSNGVMTALPPGTGTAVGINDKGQIAVNSGDAAFLWSNGVLTNLGTLGAGASATAINAHAQITGNYRLSAPAQGGPVTHGFLYSDGVLTDLGSLGLGGPPPYNVSANSINDSGQVVGYSYINGQSAAFLYTDGVMYNLNDLIPSGCSSAGCSGYFFQNATAINSAGQIVAEGSANGLYAAFLLTPVTPQFIDLGGTSTSRLSVATNSDGRLELFTRGADNALWHIWQLAPSGSWSDWQSLGGVLGSDPEVARNADGRLEVFALGSDSSLWHIAQSSAGSSQWADWSGLGGYLTSDPAVAANADGRLEVVARGGDNALWDIAQSGPGTAAWSGWNSLGGVMAGNPAVAVNADGRLEAFVLGSDQSLWHIAQSAPGARWSGWAGLGGSLAGDPVEITGNDGRVQVFARGSDSELWTVAQTNPGGPWTGFISLGGVLLGDPAVGVDTNGTIEAFAIGTDSALWRIAQSPGAVWSGWSSLGGVRINAPATGRYVDGRLVVFSFMHDSSLSYVAQYSAGSWE